jgi:hypothetical protein
MTKTDTKYLVYGSALGLIGFLSFWFIRKSVKIPEINPAIIKWDSP